MHPLPAKHHKSSMNDLKDIIPILGWIVALLSLTFALFSFAWQHLRKVNSLVGTLIANEFKDKEAIFQFSFANLGNRASLLRIISIFTHTDPKKRGISSFEVETLQGQLPQVIKAGEIITTTVKAKWNLTFLVQATKAAEKRGYKGAEFFFVVRVVCFNPEGHKYICEKHIATMRVKYFPNGHSCAFNTDAKPFRLAKDKGGGQSAVIDLSLTPEEEESGVPTTTT